MSSINKNLHSYKIIISENIYSEVIVVDKFLYGVAYYDEYMPYDRIEEDFRMMKKAGFNVIRIAESTWSTLQPKPDIFDFTHIDRMLSAAEKYGMYVIVGTPTYAVPSWLVNLDENVLVKGAKYGYRQNMDITNSTYLHYAEKVIRGLVEHTVNHPNVIGFQVDNETHHHGTSGENVQKLFKEHLIRRFDTADKMNKAYGLAYWSNSIADWDDFPDISGVQNASLGCAFEEFRRGLVSDFIKWQCDIVNEYKLPYQFITHNMDYDWESFGPWGHHDGASRGIRSDADHFDIDKHLDVTGVDIYHKTQYDLDGMGIAFSGSEMFALKDKQYLVLETQAQGFCEFVPFPNQMKLHTVAHLASGAYGILYWNWYSIHNAKETYWKGVLSHDFKENPTYNEICEVGEELKVLAPKLKNFKKKNKVALLVDNRSYTAIKWFPIHKDFFYNDVIMLYYKALYEMNIECDIIFAKGCDFKKYDVVIAPVLYCVDSKMRQRIREFVADGGTLLSGFKSFVCNEDVKVSHETLPEGMTDVFGVEYNQFVRPVGVTVNGCEADYFMELLKVTTAQSIYDYENCPWGDYSAFTKNTHKNGTAYYLGYIPNKEQLREIFRTVLTDAGVKIPAYQFPIIIKEGYADNKKLCFVMNFSKESNEYTVCGSCVDIRTEKQYNSGDRIELSPWGAVILSE